jgi:uncharacterized membrane protein YheB (UPF0754 family)
MTVLGFFLPLVHNKVVSLVTVPIFSGAIGYATNWTGVWMLFYPVRFAGVTMPGLQRLAGLLPRKIQQVPGVMQGGVGWQGIIPSRAAKMGSIAVDKGISKVGGPSDFYEQLEPEVLAEHILESSRDDIRDVVDRTLEREHPQLWRDLPPQLRELVHRRVQEQLPEVVQEVTDEIGDNIDQLLDIKLMVIRHLEAHPGLANRIFQETGRRELRFIINFGFVFGFVLGIPTAGVIHVLPYWWVLPIMGTLVGWATNWLAIRMIFEPVEPRRIGPWTWQGLFLKRQKEAADVYADVIAEDIVTIRNIGQELLHGPRSDRTREMIAAALRPAVDRATGPARAAVRVAVGTREYDNIREQVALEGVEYTMNPLKDEEFNRRQSARVRELISTRMREMDPTDFSEMLRSAMREDEWLLIAHGAVLGFGAGLVHFALFGV